MRFENGLEVKNLLIRYSDLMDKEFADSVRLTSKEDFSSWYEDNKDLVNELVALKSTIVKYLQFDISLFTVDEDTFELAEKFITGCINQLNLAINFQYGVGQHLTIKENNEKVLTDEEMKSFLEQLNRKELQDILNEYQHYLDELYNHLPSC